MPMRWMLLLVLLCPPATAATDPIYRVDWKRDGAITLGAALVGALPYLFADQLLTFRCPCNPGEVNGFDRGAIGKHSRTAAVLSDVTVAGSIAAAVLVDGLQTGWEGPFLEDMLLLSQALAVSGMFASVTKHSFPRPLPATYEGDPDLLRKAEGYRSFFSGHTSTTCTALAFLAYTTEQRHPGAVWPWIVLGVGGTASGLLRVEAGRHFYTDIIVGAAVGTAVGILVPMLHRRRTGQAMVLPIALPGGGAVALSLRW